MVKHSYDFKRIYKREDVYKKLRKRVKVGETVYDSITAAAKVLKMQPASLTNVIKSKGRLADGTLVSFLK